MLSLKDQVALVTGASRGLGRFLAEHLKHLGATVVGFSRTLPEGDTTFRHLALDVTDERAVTTVIGGVVREYGRIDVVINNAGVAAMNHSLLTPAATVERLLRTNFTGAFLVSREAARAMQRRRYGRIVNVSTVAVPMKLAGEAAYAASKSALVTWTQIFAREVAELGITANVVAPGPMETELIKNVPKATIEALVTRLPLRRLGRFEDVANVVEFFCRPESDAVTGQIVYLGGVS
jgi:3-oxoacyl-[acyl-carrier protein] reductase